VMSLSLSCPTRDEMQKMQKALKRFQAEDPTFRVSIDPESNETIASGMGELHLEVYAERMRREAKINVKTGEPKVNYRETVNQRADYNFTYKKQSGGRGQFGKIIGYFEPIPEGEQTDDVLQFVNRLVGTAVPPNFVPAIEKGFREAVTKGHLSGHQVINVRFVVEDGDSHEVDSSEWSFREASKGAFKEFYQDADPVILEPIMTVEVTTPSEFQSAVLSSINTRRGTIETSETMGESTIMHCIVPLKNMFGYSNDLRSCTQGQGEFAMEFREYLPMIGDDQQKLMEEYTEKRREMWRKKRRGEKDDE